MKPALSNGLLAFLFVALASPSAAEEAHTYVFGKAGLEHVSLSFTNAGAKPLSCKSSVAHWYSLDLGRAEKGKSVSIELWADRKTGEVFFLNAEEARMPVLALWCGIEAKSWETRFEVALERRAGTVPASATYICDEGADKVTCKAD